MGEVCCCSKWTSLNGKKYHRMYHMLISHGQRLSYLQMPVSCMFRLEFQLMKISMSQ